MLMPVPQTLAKKLNKDVFQGETERRSERERERERERESGRADVQRVHRLCTRAKSDRTNRDTHTHTHI